MVEDIRGGAPRRSYTQEDVNRILQRALERQGASGSITHDELMETADELGIDPDQLEEAIREQEEMQGIEEAREAWKVRRKRKFHEHLRSYLVVNLMLFLLDLVTSGGTWFYWPLFGWGIGLLFDGFSAYFPKEREIERGAQRILRKEARKTARVRRHRSRSAPWKTFKIDSKAGKIVIEKGDRRIEIG